MHDQEFNLGRVEALDAGIQLSELGFRREHLAAAVDAVLREERFRAGARRQQRVLAAYDGPAMAATAIEQYRA